MERVLTKIMIESVSRGRYIHFPLIEIKCVYKFNSVLLSARNYLPLWMDE